MGYAYKCRICGCNLDPNEYDLCDDCKEELEKQTNDVHNDALKIKPKSDQEC